MMIYLYVVMLLLRYCASAGQVPKLNMIFTVFESGIHLHTTARHRIFLLSVACFSVYVLICSLLFFVDIYSLAWHLFLSYMFTRHSKKLL